MYSITSKRTKKNVITGMILNNFFFTKILVKASLWIINEKHHPIRAHVVTAPNHDSDGFERDSCEQVSE